MRTVVKTTDPALLSYVMSLLEEGGLRALTFDVNASIVEGSIGILPRRVVVPEEEYAAARRILVAAGLAAELADG